MFPGSAFADFNRDGLMDIATLGQPIGAHGDGREDGDGKDDVINGAAYYANGDGTFRRAPQINSGAPLLADINGDGRPDAIGRDEDNYVFFQLNRGEAFTAPTRIPQRATTYAAGDFDHDGRVDLVLGSGTVLRNVCAAASDGPRRRASRP